MLLLNKLNIEKVYTMKDAIESVKKAFLIYSQGKGVNPLRINIGVPETDGTLLFMPTYLPYMNCATLKNINLYPNNVKKGIPTSFSQVLLIDTNSGEMIAIIDGTYVTQLRTGAATGVCFDILGKPDSKIGALIGTGGQAVTQLEAMLTVRNLDIVLVYDSDNGRKERFVHEMKEKFKHFGAEIVCAESADDAVSDADLIATVTPSKEPVFNGEKCKKGVTISCVGSYKPDMQEMDPKILKRADKIFFDSIEAVLEESGDIIIPMRNGIVDKKDFNGELGHVLSGNVLGRESDDEIIVFETVGIGMQDLVTAKNIYDKAISQNIGTVWK